MGHKGDIESRYTTHKHVLPPSVIEDMREAYRTAEKYLDTRKGISSKEERYREIYRALLKVAGYSDDEINSMGLSKMTPDDITELVRKRLFEEQNSSKPKQALVMIDELQYYLNEGWTFVSKISDRHIIVQK